MAPWEAAAYDTALVGMHAVALCLPPVLFLFDAPFGKFGVRSAWNVPGNAAWMLMEAVAPASALFFAPRGPSVSELPAARAAMLALFLVHYSIRAVWQPLTNAPRSPLHASVVASGMLFNLVNGLLVGLWLRGDGRDRSATCQRDAARSWLILLGLVLFAGGLAGNVAHDHILRGLRKQGAHDQRAARGGAVHTLHAAYAIPHGGLFRWVSYPNYLCEWVEWSGFALCCHECVTRAGSSGGLWSGALGSVRIPHRWDASSQTSYLTVPGAFPLPHLSPPTLFVLVEIAVMLPRAVRGHRWYHDRFGASYPRARRAVIPWLV
ncbi:hypothetical protein MSPP1_002332 [Malassezia sp. CBS 17886]|nr:hypothetical protein MSPP1_002332 [Malassezia sp. CBS 17886]